MSKVKKCKAREYEILAARWIGTGHAEAQEIGQGLNVEVQLHNGQLHVMEKQGVFGVVDPNEWIVKKLTESGVVTFETMGDRQFNRTYTLAKE